MRGQRPSEEQRLRQMWEAAAKIARFTEGMSQAGFSEDERTQAGFSEDERTQYAVIALLEIIGEAASRVEADFRQTHTKSPGES